MTKCAFFIISMIVFCWVTTAVMAHSTWYPHPHKNAEEMFRRGEEMKSHILFLALLFGALLSAMAVFILRQGKEEAARKIAQEQERMLGKLIPALESAAVEFRNGKIAEAIELASRIYSGGDKGIIAGATSAMFRCDGDSVSIRKISRENGVMIEAQAVRGEAGVICRLSANGEISIERFEKPPY